MNKHLAEFVDRTFARPGKALDMGAGELRDVSGLEKKGWKCEGIDIKTGVDLEKPFLSSVAPFDLVYSNYVIHKISNKQQLIASAYNNLKPGGWLFLHTFDSSDKSSNSVLDKAAMTKLLKDKFSNIKTRVFDYYDNEEGHKHWHRILEVTAQKKI